MTRLRLSVLPTRLALCRLEPGDGLPSWIPHDGAFVSITVSSRELSIVCAETAVPDRVRAERGWRALELAGPLELTLVGVLASVLAPLAAAAVPVFAVSTFDTDYVLVRDEDLSAAGAALLDAGLEID